MISLWTIFNLEKIEVAVTLEMLHLDTLLTPLSRKCVDATEEQQQLPGTGSTL